MTDSTTTRSWLRTDRIVAGSAILISACALVVSMYQTRVMARQADAAVWPRLTLEITFARAVPSIRATVRNAGVGPALVRWATVRLDGTPIASWDSLLSSATRAAGAAASETQTAALTGGVLTAGQERGILFVSGAPSLALAQMAPRLSVALCYCSVYGSCWQLHAARMDVPPGDDEVAPVRTCVPRPAVVL